MKPESQSATWQLSNCLNMQPEVNGPVTAVYPLTGPRAPVADYFGPAEGRPVPGEY